MAEYAPWLMMQKPVSSMYPKQAPQGPRVTPTAEDQAILSGRAGGPQGPLIDPYADYRANVLKQLQASQDRMGELRSQPQQQGPDSYIQAIQGALQQTGGRETQLDLSPLMALSDQWYGGNLAQNYRGTDTYTAGRQQQDVAKLQQALGARQAQLSDAESQAIAAQLKSEAYNQQVLASQLGALTPKEGRTEAADAKSKKASIANKLAYGRPKAEGDTMETMIDVARSTNRLKSMIASSGGKVPSIGSTDWARFKSQVSQLLTNYNKKAGLGALAGADLRLLSDTVGVSPEAFDKAIADVVSRGGMTAVLEDLEKDMDEKVLIFDEIVPEKYGNDADKLYEIHKKAYMKAAGRDKPPQTSEELEAKKEEIRRMRKEILFKHSR